MNNKLLLSEENGYALILALMLLTILTLSGVLVSNTTVTDLQAVRNIRIQSQNDVAAESSAMSAVQIIENEDVAENLFIASSKWAWLNNKDITDELYNKDSNNKWGVLSESTLPNIESRMKKEKAVLRYRMIGWDTSRGTSLGVYEPSLKEGKIRGVYYSPGSGISSVEMGFKKRF